MFAKVFASLWQGSMVGQADVQLVFVYLLAHANADGIVDQTHEVISALTGVSLERVRAAVEVLESPDPRSRSVAEEGRRIVRVSDSRDWGWQVVNFAHYRSLRDEESRRLQTREATRRYRERKAHELITDGSPRLTEDHEPDGEPISEDRSQKTEESNPPTPLGRPRSARPEREPEGFADFYQVYPRRDGRRAAARAFEQALRRRVDYRASDLLAAAREFAGICERSGAEQRFIPLPATWLNQDRFREFFDEGDDDGRDPEGHPDPPEGEPSGT